MHQPLNQSAPAETSSAPGVERVRMSPRGDLLLAAERHALNRLFHDDPLEAVLQTLNNGIERTFDDLRCSILLLARDGRTLHVGAAAGLPEAYNRAIDGLTIGEGVGSCGTAAARGETVLVDDIQHDPLWREFRDLAARFELAACWSTPVRSAAGDVLGTFAVYARRPGPAAPLVLEALRHLSHLAGVAIERWRSREALQMSEQRFRDFAAAASDWFWEMDDRLRFTWLSDRFREATGMAPERLLGRTPGQVGFGASDDNAWQTHQDHLAARRPFRDVVLAYESEDGTAAWFSINGTPLFDAEHRFIGYRGTGTDITQRILVERELRTSEARFRQFAESAADWLWEVDASHRFVFASDGFEKSTGVKVEDVIGRSRADLLRAHVDAKSLGEHLQVVQRHEHFRDVELRWRRPDGMVRHLRTTGVPVLDDNHAFRGYRGTTRDITEQQQLLQRISYQATHDSLTGLLNRHAFEQRLQGALEDSRARNVEHALCYLDLDQFKVVNDTCGHVAGDEMLRRIAALLQSHVEPPTVIARLGGDEFGLLMSDTSTLEAARQAEGLFPAFNAFRFRWDGKTFGVGVSVGVAAINHATGGVTRALSAADSACYLAKEEGRQRVHVYTDDDSALARRQGEMQWVARLTRAIAEDRFELAFQPIQPLLRSAEGLHYEVLLRLRDDDDSLVPPGAFLGAAERYNLVVELDRWVLSTTLAWLARQPAHLASLDLCSINLSGPALADERFLAFVIAEFERSGIPGRHICFEITETAAIANLGRAVHFIDTLRQLGCSFALDDFGSGLSSFAYLKTLPVDYLKIDGVFVRDIAEDAIDRAMVASINEIGHVMGKQTIAEFVEDEHILAVLKEIGVDYAQGYHLGRPAPLKDLLVDVDAA